MKKYYKSIMILCIPMFMYSHTLLLNILDNEDGTITIEGAFSTGESASGALIKLEAIKSKEILFKQRLNEESELIVKIPDVAYNVILDAGKGHLIEKIGISPKNGFKKESKNFNKKANKTVITSNNKFVAISTVISILLLILTIIVGVINTNRLLKQVNNK